MASTDTLKQRRSRAKSTPSDVQSQATTSDDTNPATNVDTTQTATKTQQQQRPVRLFRYLFDGIGGTVNFSFFQAPSWVDLSLPPGTTSQWDMNLGTPNFMAILTGQAIVFSPNLIWLLIAAAMYIWAPYDIEQVAASQSSSWNNKLEWFLHRAMLNSTVMLIYYGFWHTALYGLGWASRPFSQGRVYRWSKLCHNVWYCLLGCWQWTAWELVMVHLYASGRI